VTVRELSFYKLPSHAKFPRGIPAARFASPLLFPSDLQANGQPLIDKLPRNQIPICTNSLLFNNVALMHLSLVENQPETTEPIHFPPSRESETIFMRSYQTLISMGIRQHIANSMASYTAFRGEEFDPDSDVLVRVHEEIGQEPAVQGRMAA